MSLLSGAHRRIQKEAFAREAMLAGMVVSRGGVLPKPTDDEIPVNEFHLDGGLVRCSFISNPDAHSKAPTCPFEEQCDGDCSLLRES